MTGTSGPPAGSGSSPAAPRPRRLSRPRWLDPRIIIGLVLVIAAVVIGAKVIGSSKQTAGVWAAAHDLSAGTVVTEADLVRMDVNLGDSTGGYLTADKPAGGRMLNRPVSAGELLPAAALAVPAAGGRLIGIGIESGDMPPGVTHGSVIDLYLTPGGDGSTGQRGGTELVAKEVTVQSVTAPSTGGLSGASSSKYQVVLLLEAKAADSLVRKVRSGTPSILLVPNPPR